MSIFALLYHLIVIFIVYLSGLYIYKGVGDEDGDLESDFASWAGQLVPVLCEEFGVLPNDATDRAPKKHFGIRYSFLF